MLEFSLIIPVYNVKPYIRKCLDSILSQDCEDWEALLIDDGSSDGSGEICDEYAAIDPRFRVFHKENGGVSSARNVGLDNARGEWIWFVDGDDWIKNNSLSSLDFYIKSYNTDFIIFGIEYYNEGYRILASERHEQRIGYSKDETIGNPDFSTVCYVVRSNIITDNSLLFSTGVPMGEDMEFQYKCLICCKSPIYTDLVLYSCLHRRGSATNNSQSRYNAAICSVIVMEHLTDYIIKNNIIESQWLAARINRVFKNVLSSNALIGRYDRELQRSIRVSYTSLKNQGYKIFKDNAIIIGKISIRIYAAYIRLRRKLRKGYFCF